MQVTWWITSFIFYDLTQITFVRFVTTIQFSILCKSRTSHSTVWRFMWHQTNLTIIERSLLFCTHIPIQEKTCCWNMTSSTSHLKELYGGGSQWILDGGFNLIWIIWCFWAFLHELSIFVAWIITPSIKSYLSYQSFRFLFCQILHAIIENMDIWSSLKWIKTYKKVW